MTTRKINQLKKIYGDIQRQFVVKTDSKLLSGLTQFSTNDELPIHRWFHFKEGFSADLLNALDINNALLKEENSIFVDPFSGSGTTILAGDIQYQWRAKRIGFEVNPFLAFVASTKANWRKYNPSKLQKLINQVLGTPLRKNLPASLFPNLSTFHNAEIFSRQNVSQLVDIVERVKKIKYPERDLLLLGVASAAEKIGFYRKDGRALRILRDKGEIRRRRTLKLSNVLKKIWDEYKQDLITLQPQRKSNGSFKIFLSDGRELLSKGKKLRAGSVSLIAYSPPYLNHIDYTEVYKVEAWLLGFVKSSDQMRELRKKTFRSHGSYHFESSGKQLPKQIFSILSLLADEVEKANTAWHKRFRHVALGYFEDMYVSLRRQYELLRPGCKSICIVANSAHGSKYHRIPVATDLLVSVLAKEIGFDVSEIIVARRMSRRDTLNVYLRESIIIMKKPE